MSGRSAFLVVGLLSFALIATAQEDPSGLYAFEGVWIYADGEDGERRIDQAVERAIDELPFFLEPIARSRVRARTYPHHRLELRVRGERMFLSADRWGPVGSEVNGAAVPIVGPEGDRLSFTQRFVNGRLLQTFSHPDGMRENTLAVSGDGQWLWLTVRISSPQLPGEARYRLRYRRGGSTRHASR